MKTINAHTISVSELITELGSDIKQGLNSLDAAKRIKKYGSNSILSDKGKHPLKILLSQFNNLMVYLLLFALLGPAVLDELLADGIGMLAALLAAGNLSFWLCDRALAALTRYYHVILKPKLKKKF